MLGLGRALGETMAVTFVIGNTNRISPSIFAPGNTIASLVALEFPEAESGSLQLSSLLALGFILFVISFIVLAISRALLVQRVRALMSATSLLHPGATPDEPWLRGRRRGARTGWRACWRRWPRWWRWRSSPPSWSRCSISALPGLSLRVFTTVTKSPGSGRRAGQRHRRQRDADRAGHAGRHADRVDGGHVSGRICRHSALGNAVRFVSDILLSAPSILIGLFIYQVMVPRWRLLRLGRGAGAGHHRHPHRGAHDRGHAAADPDQPARGLHRARRATLENDRVHLLPRRAGRPADRRSAGRGARGRRDGAAAVHLARQLGLFRPRVGDVQPAGDDLPVCGLGLRRLGAAGLDRRAADHAGRAGDQHCGPPASCGRAECAGQSVTWQQASNPRACFIGCNARH